MTSSDEAAQLAAFEALTATSANRPANGAADNSDLNLDVILDVPVTLSLVVGHARIPIRNLLQLNQGSVVELERAAGEPLDVYVNDTLIAQGAGKADAVARAVRGPVGRDCPASIVQTHPDAVLVLDPEAADGVAARPPAARAVG